MDVIQRRRQLMGMQTGGLPTGLRRIKCLKKAYGSKQYIDTGLPMSPGQYLKLFEYEVVSVSQNVSMFGARYGGLASYDKFALWVNPNKKPAINCGSVDSGYITTVDGSGRHIISTTPSPNVTLVFDNATIYSATSTHDNSTYTGNLYIFDINNNGSVQGRIIEMYIYGINIANASGDQLNAIPALRIEDGEPGLYDFVRHVFMTKAIPSEPDFLYDE